MNMQGLRKQIQSITIDAYLYWIVTQLYLKRGD